MPAPDRITGKILLPELLAPAGSPESLRAAVAAGADAVYLSGKRFGARKYAANFSDSEIDEAIRFAHSRGVRVYITVNTLIHDRELKGVAEYLVWLYASGADAVLVQDIGIAALAREIVPDLPLHASTQMTIHNAAGVLWAAEQGFLRVVLARELALAEIQSIADRTRHTNIGLEIFAHGALCYSYSGQCLLSSVIGGRSGNRGMCAQPCRKQYALVCGKPDTFGRPKNIRTLPVPGRYVLSPKDLCTFRQLPKLVDAPIISLKIEGRMKSPEYVAVVVSTYRRALDAIRTGDWKPDPEAERDLLLAFNRGFTNGYLFGSRGKSVMGRDAPDNRGIRIGTVTGQDRKTGLAKIHLDDTCVPEPGDGLLFTGPSGTMEEWGFSLNTTPVRNDPASISVSLPRRVVPGSLVYITSSLALQAKARQIIAHPRHDPVHRIPVDLEVIVDARGRITIHGRTCSGSGKEVRISYQPDLTLVPARSRPLTRDQLEDQMRKSGDTPFVIRNCSVTYDGTLFTPVSGLNRVRRGFLAKAEEALLTSSLPRKDDVAQSRLRLASAFFRQPGGAGKGDAGTAPLSLNLSVCADTLEAVTGAVKEGCPAIWFEPAFLHPRHSCRAGVYSFRKLEGQVAEAMAVCRDGGARFVLKLPRITRNEYLDAVLPPLALLHSGGLLECMTENPGAAHAIRSLLPGITLSGGPGLNVFNHRTACHLSPPFRSLTLSPELSGSECGILIHSARRMGCRASFALMVQGSGDAMVTEDCLLEPVRHCLQGGMAASRDHLVYGIRDTTGHIFPIRTDGECRTRIGNAAETCLIDYLPAIRHAGISGVFIDACGRTGEYAGAMTRIYLDAIRQVESGTISGLPRLKDRIKTLAYGGITAGHFLRGLRE